MKKLIVLVIMLLCAIGTKADPLEVYTSGMLEPSRIHFVDNNLGFICGSGGIRVTYNAGENWFQVYGSNNSQDSTSAIYDFSFLPNGVAYAVGWSGKPVNDTIWKFSNLILKSTNNGIDWFNVMISDQGNFKMSEWQEKINKRYTNKSSANIVLSVCAINESTVVAGGSSNNVFVSTDAGASWVEYPTNWNSIVRMTKHDNLIYGSEWGRLFTSSNNGVNWIPTLSDPISCISDMDFKGNRIFTVGSYGYFMAYAFSNDKGANWSSVILPDSGYFSGVMFLSELVGYAVGSQRMIFGSWNIPRGYIYKTVDGGLNWEIIFEQDWFEMSAITKNDNYVYFAGTTRVARLPLTLTGSNNNYEKVEKFSLKQNYPNPFNPVTKIIYSVPKNSQVTLKVYDISGREIQTLVNEKQATGNYEIGFDGNKLTSGVYFYRLTAGDFTETKKMILIK